MKKLATITGAVALAVSGACFAGGPDQAYAAQPAQSKANNGFYAGLGAGAAIPSNGTDFDATALKTGYNAGGEVGYRLENFRFEGAVDYTNHGVKQSTADIVIPDIKENLKVVTVMGNAYYDFKVNPTVVPFVGLGIGLAHLTDSVKISDISSSKSQNKFALQAIAGVGFNINKKLRANVTYKFRRIVDNFNQNIIGASLDYYI